MTAGDLLLDRAGTEQAFRRLGERLAHPDARRMTVIRRMYRESQEQLRDELTHRKRA